MQQQRSMSSRRILVVGGGIAGFAMVRAFAQRGIAATVVDRLSGPPDAGLGLNLPGNAVRALHELGVGDGLRERGMPVLRREYRNARDRLLFAVDEAGFWGGCRLHVRPTRRRNRSSSCWGGAGGGAVGYDGGRCRRGRTDSRGQLQWLSHRELRLRGGRRRRALDRQDINPRRWRVAGSAVVGVSWRS